MKKNFLVISFLFLLFFPPGIVSSQSTIKAVPFTAVKFNDKFWAARLKTHAHVTLPTCIAQLRDSTSRISNFQKAAGLKPGKFEGTFFDDSDVYKAMEGMAYSLQNNPNPEIEAILDEWIGYIAKAQQKDGYLNTFFTLPHSRDYWDDHGRWTDFGRHEMYCGGHMIEAAVAFYNATGKTTFLEVAKKFADHLDATFGPGKRNWVPGHQEIELALVKLYNATNEKRYLDLSKWILDERGKGFGMGPMWMSSDLSDRNCQNEFPVASLDNIEGHAVRDMYMFTGMADVSAAYKDTLYHTALHKLWDDVVLRNMYITGGIGSSNTNEGFVGDYDLPNKTAYSETCASVGMVFWNNRMSLLTGDAKYADVMERAMYNAVLAGVSLSGDRFFYVNPLESDGGHHRQRWFGTACCPSNISRFLPSVGNYFYMTDDQSLYVNLYAGSEASFSLNNTRLNVTQITNYPWNGDITIKVDPEHELKANIKLRIPDWCKSYSLRLNGKKVAKKNLEEGYVIIDKTWKKGDVLSLILDMPVEMVAADPRVKADVGKRAVQRGPVVYCIEKAGNENIDVNNVVLTSKNKFQVSDGQGILNGIKVLQTSFGGKTISLIPYYAWDNRQPGKMLVWVDYKK
ncbi:MAG: beta-L-arabinofuranosidase domain-containing protein [Ginsengibacter sp.]